jgi:hypothetical protein
MIKKTTELQNQAIRSPFVMGLAGAALGVVAAKLIRGATAGKWEERVEWYDEVDDELEGDGADVGVAARTRARGVKRRAADVASGVADRAADLKDRAVEMKDRAVDAVDDAVRAAGDRASRLRERMPSAGELRDRGRRVVRQATEEQPAIGALLALGAGIALGMLLPVTEAEEKALAPVVDRAAENLGHLEEKVRDLTQRLDEKIAGEKKAEDPVATTTPPWPTNPV